MKIPLLDNKEYSLNLKIEKYKYITEIRGINNCKDLPSGPERVSVHYEYG